MDFELKPLPYAVNALAPYLGAEAANLEAEAPRAQSLSGRIHAFEAPRT